MINERSVKEEVLRKIRNLECLREAKRLPKFYSISDLSLMFQCDTDTIERIIQESKIHFFKVGRLTRFDPEDVQNYIRYHSTKANIQFNNFKESLELEKQYFNKGLKIPKERKPKKE